MMLWYMPITLILFFLVLLHHMFSSTIGFPPPHYIFRTNLRHNAFTNFPTSRFEIIAKIVPIMSQLFAVSLFYFPLWILYRNNIFLCVFAFIRYVNIISVASKLEQIGLIPTSLNIPGLKVCYRRKLGKYIYIV